jgi:hypothetical protein
MANNELGREEKKMKTWLMPIQDFGPLVSWMFAYISGEPTNRVHGSLSTIQQGNRLMHNDE